MDKTTAKVHFIVKRDTANAAVDTAQGLRFILSTETPDLAGDIVVQSGLVPAYQPLPAMLDHGVEMADLIGVWRDIANSGARTSARLELLPQGVSDGADLVRALHKAGIRLAASVKFLPDELEEIRAKGEARSFPPKFRYLRSRLVEASVVAMPCNAEALQEVGKSLPRFRAAIDQLVSQEAARTSETRAKAVAAVQRVNALLSR
jgi:hypothetical protein